MASACYLYAIVQSGGSDPPHNLMGLNGEPLTLVRWQALAAVTSMTFDSTVQPRAALLARHAAVVEVICQRMPALPVRFGTVLPDSVAVAHALEQRYDVLRSDLMRIGGKQELGVTVLWGGAEDSSQENLIDTSSSDATGVEYLSAYEQGRGTRYLLARKDAYQRDQATQKRARAVIADLDNCLRTFVCESRCEIHVRPQVNVRATYLLEPEAVPEARNALARYQDQHCALHLLVTGPWPPYSFMSSPDGPGTLTEQRPVHNDGSLPSP